MPAPLPVDAGSPTARPGERWYWRGAALAPVVFAPVWITLGRQFGANWPLPSAAGALLVLLLVAVLITDLRSRRIPNWATYTATLWLIALVALAAVFGETIPPTFGTPSPGDALGGLLLGFFAMLFLFSIFGGGAGDVKLTAALGGLLGVEALFSMLVYAYIVAGAFAVIFVVWRVGPLNLLASLGSAVFPSRIRAPAMGLRSALRLHVPMAPFLAAGVILTLVFRTI